MSGVTFPHLSPDAFTQACRQLADCFNLHGHLQQAWHSVKLTTDQEGQLGLQIVRRIEESAPVQSSDPDDSDEEALPYRPGNPQAKVEYSIYPSPSYRVPVLYIGIQDFDGGATTSIDRMGDLLIPPHFKSQVEKVGTIGAVSMTVSGIVREYTSSAVVTRHRITP